MFFLHKKHTDLLNSEHILTQNVSQFDIKISRGKVSSILKRGYQDNFKPVFFFFKENISCAQKHSQGNINQQNKIKQTLKNKSNNFSRAQKLLKGWKSFALRLVLFVRLKPFREKINRLEIVLITSIFYTTDVYWLYVLAMSRTRFRVNPHSIVAWMTRNSLLETGAKSEV